MNLIFNVGKAEVLVWAVYESLGGGVNLVLEFCFYGNPFLVDWNIL